MENRKISFVVTIEFDNAGYIDREQIEANLNYWIEKARAEGGITPDHDDHAMLESIDVMPA